MVCYLTMQIRSLLSSDLERIRDIDGTIESVDYLHLECSGEGLAMGWRLEQRPLRSKLVQSNPIDDEQSFILKQIVTGTEEGLALLAEHDEAAVALLLAQPHPAVGTLRIVDLRVDYDYRRQGLGSALLYQAIQQARDHGLRAVCAETRTNNLPASQLLIGCNFSLAGVDTHRYSNHDVVKEAATLFWYAPMD